MEGLAIGRFRITRKLGAGGMAEVYEAKHELMNRYAAVKLLRPEMSARGIIVQRFFHEAQAAASIEHPGIVHVYDVGYTNDGRAYLVMELLSGETLSQRLQRHKRLSLEATVTMIRQLAGAVGAAHQRGIVHRDLKPDNIFLVPDPEMPQGERVKVLDFGLAKLLEAAFPGGELTAQGSVFGTPAYMAPEQCRSSGNVDQRADLYAIGCIFYMCLCDHAPFGTGGIEVLLAQVSQAPVPPRKYAPDTPVEIEELILQLLAKDPDRRLPSCDTFIAQLDRVVERLPEVFSRKSSSSDELTMRDNPTLQGALAFAVRQEPGARASADRAPSALPGLGQVRDHAPEQPRRAPKTSPAEPTQHLTTQALMPLDVEEDTDRISVPANHGIAGPLSTTALTPVDDAEPLSDDSVELIDDEQVAASERETTKLKAQDTVHLRATAKLSARSPLWAKETQRMRPGTGVDMGATQPLTRGGRKGTDVTVRPLPGVPEPVDQRPRPLPGVPAAAPGHSPEISPARPDEVTHAPPGISGRVDDAIHASPGVPGPEHEARDEALAARASAAGGAIRAPAQAMQLRALPWEPDAPGAVDAGAQQPGEPAEQGDKASRASTPTLSNGELERRPRPEPRRRVDRRALWVAVGVAGLVGLILAGMLLGKSGDPGQRPATEPENEVQVPEPVPPPADPEQARRERQIDELLHQADQAMDAKNWEKARDLLAEARAIEGAPEQGARLDEMARRMAAEKENQAAFERLGVEAEKQRLDRMFEELAKIPEDSVYRTEAREAALEATRSRITRLLHRGDCKALAGVIAEASRALPEVKGELEVQTANCVHAAATEAAATGSGGKRDAAQILSDIRNAYTRNQVPMASRRCQELRNLGQVNGDAAWMCGTVACKSKNWVAAKWYYGRATQTQARSLIAQTCLKEGGFDVQK
jgi:serine/threonine protein kinase